MKSKIGPINGPTKWTLVQQRQFSKEKKYIIVKKVKRNMISFEPNSFIVEPKLLALPFKTKPNF